ncbi:MAG: protein-L-isoaspartate(D-aspartate) O-methyltransferase [Rhizobiales bacterium]|nr:protein-L-isoaspartate(D-aspartate) O-methyltransferase [Hyphomicrobiales bacterium]MBO6698395.1 protein-L-isoaspartate(D-aspartate) O-methyltransferase [Hyphomicrobiales bacterium]MBO6735351.1 protein-L-isoaspartate(D-aspartate) O-methyltransferase [Hyphomicrobiales bacterium]MBO6910841.1 protein-L-isoaspartate(D-aspartate) O-methyltransferase [Hyphomicrobiales bacterium]MBO6955897.1 protein-L-isoaspartate(D-aspartate) O-methyltransferase [Hyphomicrobiales bacterium]
MSSDDALRRASLVLRLRSMGITDHRLVSAFESTRREAFAPEHYASDAYADRLIPIACGQTMEAPSVLARLLQAAPIASHMSVLEIGAGSGYFSALLAKLSRRVVALERYRGLVEGARVSLSSQGVSNVDLVLADGLAGWPAAGPYQAIFVTGSIEALPAAWIDQLAPGGKLIAPIGPPNGPQTWISVSKDEDDSLNQEVIGTAFSIALEPGLARAL